ncbi:ABC-2 type transport system permease protein [Agromyces terreus]|uniref:ABC-2 type transport system permease protein n=1 Tax=Agromyces terreus TaxID=424795 RepID=A0A9X2H2T4_9MICO|nr:ABC transporter permease [Agromyces terreus]MCP2371538.1 ABC-2 type transport system permease protein [Agromyces terreus]
MTALAPARPSAATPGRTAPVATFAGFPDLTAFIVRRNWLRLTLWVVILVGMVAMVFESQRVAFPTQESRDAYAAIANTPAVAALTGLPYGAGTLGGILNIKIWMTLAVSIGFASIFLLTRNGRAEEEAGRTELIRAGAVGHHAYSLANQLVVGGLSVVVGLLIGLTCIGLGLPAEGSLAMGASIAGVGIAFLGIAAVAGQLTSTSRAANSLASIVLGVSYLVRAIADVRAEGETPDALSWASPIGWAQNMRSFGENTWWPLLLLVGVGVGGCLVAAAVESRRDVGAGVLPDRAGPPRASRRLTTTLGLAVRLQRGPMIGWLLGGMVGGAFYGGVANAMADLLASGNPMGEVFAGGADTMLDGLLGLFLMVSAMVAAGYTVQAATAVRLEEASGRLEPQVAGAVSRTRWASVHYLLGAVWGVVILAASGLVFGVAFAFTASDPAQVWRIFAASLAYVPTLFVLAGVAVFLTGWLPRATVLVSWIVFGASAVIAIFGPLFSLSEEAIAATPFAATPRVPGVEFEALPLVVLSLVALALWALGLARFRARDLTLA